MAISRLPGVGPDNSDVATAVAAAVPTLGQITGALPSLAQIDNSVATNASPFTVNWTQIYANTGAIGAATLTISGLSSYKFLRIMWNGAMVDTTNAQLYVRFNADSGSNYFYFAQTETSTTSPYSLHRSNGYTTEIRCGQWHTTTDTSGYFEILGSNNTTGPKTITNAFFSDWNGTRWTLYRQGVAFYKSNSAITEINFSNSAGSTFNSGTRFVVLGGS